MHGQICFFFPNGDCFNTYSAAVPRVGDRVHHLNDTRTRRGVYEVTLVDHVISKREIYDHEKSSDANETLESLERQRLYVSAISTDPMRLGVNEHCVEVHLKDVTNE